MQNPEGNMAGTIFVSLILLAVVCAIIAKMIRDKKKGKSCAGCPSCGMCSKHGGCEKHR